MPPNALNRTLPPSRSASLSLRLNASVIAAIAGVSSDAETPSSSSAPMTGHCPGNQASTRADTMIAPMPDAVTRRFNGTASTSIPAGTWPATAAIVPMLSAKPISVGCQPFAVR